MKTSGQNTKTSGPTGIQMFVTDIRQSPVDPATLYLFGRVEHKTGLATATAAIRVLREVLLEPRGEQTRDAVQDSLEMVLPDYDGSPITPVQARYPFGDDQPFNAEHPQENKTFYRAWLNPATSPEGLSTRVIQHTYGLTVPLVTQFILRYELRGPSWLRLEVEEADIPFSWTAHSYHVLTMSRPRDLPPPPIKVMALGVGITQGEIRAAHVASAWFHPDTTDESRDTDPPRIIERLNIFAPFKTPTFPHNTAMRVDDEVSLLQMLLTTIHSSDPDIIICPDAQWRLPFLMARCKARNVAHWSYLERLRRADIPDGYERRVHPLGRVLYDPTQGIAMLGLDALMRPPRLVHLADGQLSHWDMDWPDTCLLKVFEEGVMPLVFEASRVFGCPMEAVFADKRMGCVDLMLGHAAPKDVIRRDPGRVQSSPIEGGTHLAPKRGLHRTWVGVLDYKSMYPRIITSRGYSVEGQGGFLSRLLTDLMDRREKATGPVQGLVYKLAANMVYGILGCPSSRFYDPQLAAQVTEVGRWALGKLTEVAEKEGMNVIYGVTDSAFVDTGLDSGPGTRFEALTKLMAVVRVTEAETGLLIKLDGLYSRTLLIEKNKYAAMKLTDPNVYSRTTMVFKGTENLSATYCPAVQAVTEVSLADALSMQPTFHTLVDNIGWFKPTLADCVIGTRLGKDPADYLGAQAGLPLHVLIGRRTPGARKGSTVYYVVCQAHGRTPLHKRVFTPEEAEEQGKEPDVAWYKANHLIPILTRIVQAAWPDQVQEFKDAVRVA